MGSPTFTAVLLALLISACLSDDATATARKVETSTAIIPSNTSNIESATAESTTNSANTSKPSKSGESVKPQLPNPLDSGVYTRAFCVLVALGGLVIIYLAGKAFWRTRRARAAAAAQSKSSINVASTGRRSAGASDRSGLMATDEEEDEESTVFDQSRERLLKASARNA